MKNLSKKFKIIFCIISIIILAGTFFLGVLVGNGSLDGDVRELKDFLKLYKAHYLFEDENAVEIMENSVLDDYSRYFTKEEYEEYVNSSNGNKYGVGFGITNDLIVTNVSFNSSAFLAGIKVGDKITKIFDGDNFVDASYSNLANLVNTTKENVDITVKILRDSNENQITFQKREYNQTFVSYQSNSGSYYFVGNTPTFTRLGDCEYTLKNEVGYIKYTNFAGAENNISSSVNQLVVALEKFKEEGKTDLVFDLRNNGGGYMSVLEKVSAYLVKCVSNNTLIHTVIYKNGYKEKYYSEGNYYSNYSFNKIYVLVNENTASASEALVGAMLDYDGGNSVKVLIEGHDKNSTKVYSTYGKGIMQSTYTLANGDCVKLTVAKNYFPLSNICIHGVGITTALNETYNNCIVNVDGNLVDYANSCVA